MKFAKELARLHREHGVELINFADELPTGSRKAWKAFLEALIAEDVSLTLVGSTRAGDIVRDADILHLYKQAGVVRFLLGIESYDEAMLRTIRKGATASEDQQAIGLLRRHGILSMATYAVGFEEESDADYWRSLRHLLRYDPDQIQMLYVTPHRWTPFFETVAERRVIETDTRRWDYQHQVLATARVPPWRIFMWVKAIEVIMQLRPRALLRVLFGKDRHVRHGMRWYARMGRPVWFHEVLASCAASACATARSPCAASWASRSRKTRNRWPGGGPCTCPSRRPNQCRPGNAPRDRVELKAKRLHPGAEQAGLVARSSHRLRSCQWLAGRQRMKRPLEHPFGLGERGTGQRRQPCFQGAVQGWAGAGLRTGEIQCCPREHGRCHARLAPALPDRRIPVPFEDAAWRRHARRFGDPADRLRLQWIGKQRDVGHDPHP